MEPYGEKISDTGKYKKAFEMLKNNGHLTFICSGRTLSYIQDERLLALGFDGIVAGCGTYVEKAGEVLFFINGLKKRYWNEH